MIHASAASHGGLLSGSDVARAVRAEIRTLLERRQTRPGLAVVVLSDDAASRKYAQSKVRACADLGMSCVVHDLAPYASDVSEIHARLRAIAGDPAVHGLLVEHPLPSNVDPLELYAEIPEEKDVEGIGYANMGRLMLGRPRMVPSTAAAVMRILDHYEIPLSGKRAVVVGRSNIVGKPVAALLLARDATVVQCHSRTPDLAAETTRADVLVVSVGRPRFIGADHVREGAVVVDVGINFEQGRLVGDVDSDAVQPKAQAITPVPGGVGPVTTAMLLWNLVHASTD